MRDAIDRALSNQIDEMFHQDFYTYLEYHLTRAFKNSDQEMIKKFWCDGVVSVTDKHIIAKAVNYKRELVTAAFIGNDGQERYELIIKFGKTSLSRCARNLSIRECIPDAEDTDWYSIDTERKILTIYLLYLKYNN